MPAGTTTVHFSYLPPHSEVTVGVAVLAALALVGSLLYPRIRRRRPVSSMVAPPEAEGEDP